MFGIFVLIFFLGAAIGSFVHAAVYRMHANAHRAPARSRCAQCQSVLRPIDLIPIVSFLLLRARCRTCRARIALHYLLTELVAGFLAVISVIVFGLSWEAIFVAIAACTLLFFFLYDAWYQEVPDRVILPAIIILGGAHLLLGAVWSDLALGVLIGGGFFLAQFAVSRGRWIGGGDIRLGVLTGVLLGWQGTIAALFLAYAAGALVAVALLATRNTAFTLHSRVPFGSFLTGATAVCLLTGPALIDWYLQLL